MDGVANVVNNYAYWLNKKYGFDYVITPAFPNYQAMRSFQFFVINLFPYLPAIQSVWCCRPWSSFFKLIREIPFDIVHANSPFSADGIAFDIARRRNIPLVASFHCKYYDDFKFTFKSDFLVRQVVKKIIRFLNPMDDV